MEDIMDATVLVRCASRSVGCLCVECVCVQVKKGMRDIEGEDVEAAKRNLRAALELLTKPR